MLCNIIEGVGVWLFELIAGFGPLFEQIAYYTILGPTEWLIVGFFGC
jgi:hypothetical protein